MAEHNRAAFSRADVEDARRGHPDFELRDHASWLGMEFMDHTTPAGYRAALPCQAELQTNVLRGALPGGEYGILAHEGLEVGWTVNGSDWGGTFYGVRITAGGGERFRLRDALKPLIPGWGVFGRSAEPLPARVPCTVASVRVPETAGTHPYMRIDTRRSSPPFSFTNRTKLDDLIGEDGWSLWCEPKPERETVEGLVAGPVGELLRAHSEDGLFQVVVWFGTLVVRRNGFLRPEGLDELGRAAGVMAGRLREVCRPLTEPRPFDAQLPPLLSSEARDLPAGFYPGEPWRKWALETAERYGLAIENPVAYHRAFPTVPVPGTAYLVLQGKVPHVGQGRLVIHKERDAFRAAVLVAAPPGVQTTPPGGVHFREQDARLEVADGLLAVWGTTSWSGYSMLDHIDAFCGTAAAVIKEPRPGPAPL